MVSLISGMDEIVEYIKTLEIKNKKLEEENEQLKQQVSKKQTINDNHALRVSNLKSMLKQLEQDANDKLEEQYKQIEELKEKQKKLSQEDKEKIDEANDILKEYKELKEFKEKADEECEASAVMDTMMERIEKAESDKNMWYERYKNQEPIVKAYTKENELLGEALIKSYNLDDSYAINRLDWDDRFSNFYNQVMTKVREVEWIQLLEDNDIHFETYDGIESEWEDTEIREQYCRETQGDEEDAEDDWNSIVNEGDWDEWEGAFVEWYLNDYIGGDNWWGDYDGNYWVKK